MAAMADAHALVIGISDYQHIGGLPPVIVRDACDVRETLTDSDICRYQPGKVKVLLDRQASRSAILDALAELAECAENDDAVFIYFSGHGGRVGDEPAATEFLLPADARLSEANALPQLDADSAVSGETLYQLLRSIRSRKLVAVFDCCHSGGLGHPKGAGAQGYRTGLSEAYFERLAAGRGRAILASSHETEVSWVLPNARNSLFTHHLLQGLRGGAPNPDGFTHVVDLFEFIHPRVTADAPSQHPVLYARIEEDFPIAYHPGGDLPGNGDSGDYRYDVYLSWVRAPEDTAFVSGKLLPVLRSAGLRIAMTGYVEEPGIPSIYGMQRAVEFSRRTVAVLSESYLKSEWAKMENVTAQYLSLEERRVRLLPVVIDPKLLDWERHLNRQSPLSLRQLAVLDLTDEMFGAQNLQRLPGIIRQPAA